MLTRLFESIRTKRAEWRFRRRINREQGSLLIRTATALALREIEDPWVSKAALTFSPAERPIFRIAYQCFVLWEIRHLLRDKVRPIELHALTGSVRELFENCDYHDRDVFEKIWPCTDRLMRMALEGGSQKKPVYPIVQIIEAANQSGHSLPHNRLDYEQGMHVVYAMNHMAITLSACEESVTNQQQ